MPANIPINAMTGGSLSIERLRIKKLLDRRTLQLPDARGRCSFQLGNIGGRPSQARPPLSELNLIGDLPFGP
jgi:hypothetical protein